MAEPTSSTIWSSAGARTPASRGKRALHARGSGGRARPAAAARRRAGRARDACAPRSRLRRCARARPAPPGAAAAPRPAGERSRPRAQPAARMSCSEIAPLEEAGSCSSTPVSTPSRGSPSARARRPAGLDELTRRASHTSRSRAARTRAPRGGRAAPARARRRSPRARAYPRARRSRTPAPLADPSERARSKRRSTMPCTRARNGRKASATTSVAPADTQSEPRPTATPSDDRDRDVVGREQEGQRPVDRRAVDEALDRVEPVADDRDPDRGHKSALGDEEERERYDAAASEPPAHDDVQHEDERDQRRAPKEP